jgi:hypothetical protein
MVAQAAPIPLAPPVMRIVLPDRLVKGMGVERSTGPEDRCSVGIDWKAVEAVISVIVEMAVFEIWKVLERL